MRRGAQRRDKLAPKVERLLIVEECFAAPGGKVLVTPKLESAPRVRAPFPVELRLPSGERKACTASLDFAHIQGPLPSFAMVRLAGVRAEDVPPGTEIWATLPG
jgi:hypothetical protein